MCEKTRDAMHRIMGQTGEKIGKTTEKLVNKIDAIGRKAGDVFRNYYSKLYLILSQGVGRNCKKAE